MKRVLVTGANGFIGRHSLWSLLERGYEVHGVSNSDRAVALPGVIWHRANLLSRPATQELVSSVRPSHLLHLAWYVEPGRFWTAPANVEWLEASLGLLRLFAQHGGERIVVAGTCAEYDWRYGFCSENLTPIAPTTLYGSCKHALHIALRAFCDESGISAAWGRIFFLYGPFEPPAKLVASVIHALLSGRIAPTSEGRQLRDFLHVQDVANAFAALLDSPVVGPLNIASGQPIAIRDVVATIGSLVGRPELISYGALPTPPNEPPLLVGDRARLQELDWKAQFTIETGLAQAVMWWRGQLESR